MNSKKQFYLLIAPAAIVLLVMFIIPVIFILFSSLKDGGIEKYKIFLSDTFYLGILWNTIRISLITTFVCLAVG